MNEIPENQRLRDNAPSSGARLPPPLSRALVSFAFAVPAG